MAETIFRGPGVSLGSLLDGRVEPFDGPSVGYQGDIIGNPAFGQPKDGLSPGRIHGWYNAFYNVSMDAIPSATSTTTVAAAQAVSTTVGATLNLVTTTLGTNSGAQSFAAGIPIIPLGSTSVVTCAALDFGFTTGTTTAASTSIIVTDNRLFTIGQWICVASAGGATNTPLFAQVVNLGTASPAVTTVINVSVAAGTTSTNPLPIGQANLYNAFTPSSPSGFGPLSATPNAVEPYRLAGLSAAFDPTQACCRNLVVQAASIGSGTTAFLVTGYDVYGQLMAEKITANGTTTVAGKKAFKYIQNIAVNIAATSGTPAQCSFGQGDEVGFNIRSDKWEYSDIFYGGGFVVSTQGWTAAILGTATNTSGDVRGVVNASTVLTISTTTGSTIQLGTLTGANRMTIFQNVPLVNAISGTPINYTSLLGIAQATA